jgi:hypothetical protein
MGQAVKQGPMEPFDAACAQREREGAEMTLIKNAPDTARTLVNTHPLIYGMAGGPDGRTLSDTGPISG